MEVGLELPRVALKRRKQVKSACSNCRKSKTACCDQRPCRRCISLGLADSCIDVPRKRREKKKDVEALEGTDCFKFVVVNPAAEHSTKLTHCPRLPEYPQSHQIQIQESSTSSYASSPMDDEKRRLQDQIDQLMKERAEQNQVIESLRMTLHTHQLFSGLSLSHWKLLVDGICHLQSFSNGFQQLISHTTNDLHSTYTCVKMYPRQEFPKTQKLFGLIASGRVESLTARVPLVRGTGELIEVFSIMKIEFRDDKPAFLTMCMKEYDPHGVHGDLPFFEPTHVRLRPLLQYAGQANVPSISRSPNEINRISIQEIYSPDSTPSPTMVEQNQMPYPPLRMERSAYPVAGGQQYYPPSAQSYYAPAPLGHVSQYGQPLRHTGHLPERPNVGYNSRRLLASLPQRASELHWNEDY